MFETNSTIKLISIILAVGIGLISCRSFKPFNGNQDDLQDIIENARIENMQPSIAAALITLDNGIITAVSGTTLYNGNKEVNINSRFHIGSTTKSMTALIIAGLVQKGILEFSMTLKEALPHIKMLNDYENVTIHDLLLSRAGIIPMQNTNNEDPEIVNLLWFELPKKYTDPVDQRKALAEAVLNYEPINTPGTKSVYSNVGWAIAGYIAEYNSGLSYEDLLKNYIFEPLCMTNSMIGGWPASLIEQEQPRGHYSGPHGEIIPQELDDEYTFPDWMNPAGGVHCSIGDFALYAQEHLLGLKGRGRLLDKEYYELLHLIHAVVDAKDMYQGVSINYDLNLAYGWGIIYYNDFHVSAANGTGGTFYARLVIFPWADTAFAGFTNAGNGAGALDSVLKELTGFKL
jgi:CubicO group peptidase (beta-lactamase class C family)